MALQQRQVRRVHVRVKHLHGRRRHLETLQHRLQERILVLRRRLLQRAQAEAQDVRNGGFGLFQDTEHRWGQRPDAPCQVVIALASSLMARRRDAMRASRASRLDASTAHPRVGLCVCGGDAALPATRRAGATAAPPWSSGSAAVWAARVWAHDAPASRVFSPSVSAEFGPPSASPPAPCAAGAGAGADARTSRLIERGQDQTLHSRERR